MPGRICTKGDPSRHACRSGVAAWSDPQADRGVKVAARGQMLYRVCITDKDTGGSATAGWCNFSELQSFVSQMPVPVSKLASTMLSCCALQQARSQL